jgi:hypothetical protein
MPGLVFTPFFDKNLLVNKLFHDLIARVNALEGIVTVAMTSMHSSEILDRL